MPDSLNRFKQETQDIIIQWFKKESNNKENDLEDDDYYIDPILIIEWNCAGLQNRNIQQTNVVAGMYKNILKKLFCCIFNYFSISYSSIPRLSTNTT